MDPWEELEMALANMEAEFLGLQNRNLRQQVEALLHRGLPRAANALMVTCWWPSLTGGWHNGCGRYATLEAAMSASQEEIWREGGIPLPGEMDLGGE